MKFSQSFTAALLLAPLLLGGLTSSLLATHVLVDNVRTSLDGFK